MDNRTGVLTAQSIHLENRKKAAKSHQAELERLGPVLNVPFTLNSVQAIQRHEQFKPRLILFLQRKARQRHQIKVNFTIKYKEWQRKVDEIENSKPRKASMAKSRLVFERTFPTIRKKYKDERFTESKVERNKTAAAVIPAMVDPWLRKQRYINQNARIADLAKYMKDGVKNWSPQENEVFTEKYLLYPKNFRMIASFLEKKSTADCVEHYYLTKKTANLKKLLPKRSGQGRTRTSKSYTDATKVNAEDHKPAVTEEEDSESSTSSCDKPQEKSAATDKSEVASTGSPVQQLDSQPYKTTSLTLDPSQPSHNRDLSAGTKTAEETQPSDLRSCVHLSQNASSTAVPPVSSSPTAYDLLGAVIEKQLMKGSAAAGRPATTAPTITSILRAQRQPDSNFERPVSDSFATFSGVPPYPLPRCLFPPEPLDLSKSRYDRWDFAKETGPETQDSIPSNSQLASQPENAFPCPNVPVSKPGSITQGTPISILLPQYDLVSDED